MIGILLLVTVSYFLVIGYNYKIKEKAYDYLNTQRLVMSKELKNRGKF